MRCIRIITLIREFYVLIDAERMGRSFIPMREEEKDGPGWWSCICRFMRLMKLWRSKTSSHYPERQPSTSALAQASEATPSESRELGPNARFVAAIIS